VGNGRARGGGRPRGSWPWSTTGEPGRGASGEHGRGRLRPARCGAGEPATGNHGEPRAGATGVPPRDEAHGALRDGGTTGDPAARVATREDPGTGDDRGARDGGSLGELGTVGDPGEPRARVPNRRARDGGQVGSRDGDTRGRAGRGGNHSDRPHRPHGRLRNVEAGGVRRHDRRGRLHHISPMSDTPFWSFVML
jgi:hypothetical protein